MVKFCLSLCMLFAPMAASPLAKEIKVEHQEDVNIDSQFTKTLFLIIGVLLLLFLTAWFLRKITKSRSDNLNHIKNIKVIESRPLSPKTMLYLVEVGGRQIVISESQIHVKEITTFDWVEKNS